MSNKNFLLSIFLILNLNGSVGALEHPMDLKQFSYPNFQDNPYLDERMRVMMTPYLLPLDHPVKTMLDCIFSQSRAIENKQTLIEAGFIIIASMPGSFVIVARHPLIPGYVFKLYLDTEMRSKDGIANCEWLTRRCMGAEKIKRTIRQRKIRHFTVPDKWLYVLPLYPFSNVPHPQPVILVASDMEPEGEEVTQLAWKTSIQHRHLDELYAILKHGYGTTGLVRNIPYTKSGKFAFIDTEYPERHHKLKKIKTYLSEEMQGYWDTLIR